MGLGYALTEELVCEHGMPVTFKLRDLGVLRARDMPEVKVILVEDPEPEGPVRRQGRRRDRPRADGARRGERAGGLRWHPPLPTLPMKDSPAGARDERRQGEARRGGRRDRLHIVTAGLVNAHTHLYSGLAPFGMPAPEPPPENFVQILERVWWRLDRALDDELAARQRAALRGRGRSCTARPRSWITTSRRSSSRARSTSSPTRARRSGCARWSASAPPSATADATKRGAASPSAGASSCRTAGPLVRGAIGLHASFTVSDETIREAGRAVP